MQQPVDSCIVHAQLFDAEIWAMATFDLKYSISEERSYLRQWLRMARSAALT
jgi:hypothetical protein